jgi:hypothetical protein
MNPLLIIFGGIFLLMVINANLIQTFLDSKTKYKNFDIYDQSQILFLFVFFGIFCLPFMKQIKQYRKRLYLKNRRKDLNNRSYIKYKESLTDDMIDEEIFNIERTLKLERLKRRV